MRRKIYTLMLPLPPNLANSRMAWQAKHQAKKAYWRQCDNRVTLGEVAKADRRLPLAYLYADVYLGRPMDPDNLVARLKWTIDWLVTRGYLEDDDAVHLRFAEHPRQFSPTPKAARGVKITLEERGGVSDE